MHLLQPVLISAALVTGVASAAAPGPHSAMRTHEAASVQGRVVAYSLTSRGDVDGLILEDGLEAHIPPHLSAALVFTVRPGDAVTVRGTKGRNGPVIDASSITNDKTGQSVQRATPAGQGDTGMQAEGKVKLQLHDPRGDVNGVMLEDGTQIHIPQSVAQGMSSALAPGQKLYAEGTGYSGPLGKSIAAREIGPDKASAATVDTMTAAAPQHPPRHGKKGAETPSSDQ
ncbi:MAG TPA: hypothetical protein VLI93_05505 [Acetobacteraceae bacterium]|nr:hypothetical protein [Acetobacteraceae bacterium]